ALDLEHVVAGPPLELRFDLAWALAARNVLKAFGARLLGFGSSSVPHLWENALAGLTLVRVRGDVVEVELPRVPLDVVLRLSGVDGRTYTVPWLPDLVTRLRVPSGDGTSWPPGCCMVLSSSCVYC